ncbi:hypothetical protein LTR47_009573 [Exophiala xenobiotica]|nr:hypothetical protein LTR72_010349 [Exophiala xenobiotica]KAK5225148.1 hypothetical protein LTR47_009573 [Exophiala xenobiotica]KAK5315504.1 hypothetical protein LTR93_009759 [Exophiala xenobiotica]KAK5391787.1 hypothetical protein LTR79_010886 [Exophiala xenobiotica]KAK5406446.1 hypothetical protein LTR90_010521 [Exophiala xenobiotica]
MPNNPNSSMLQQLQHVSDQAVKGASDDLKSINWDIHSHPEVLFEEHHAHEVLTAFLEHRGFDVERGAFGLPTAFKASFGPSTGRAVAVNLEYDALEVIGHACGHSLISCAGLAAVVGVAEAIKQGGINGRIVALGTPAEEGGGGKIKMIRSGAYEESQIIRQKDNAYVSTMCGAELTIEYIGKPAHAMAAPWDGINALDAVTLLQTSIGLLRQQIMPSDRIRGVVLSAGQRSGVIPAYAKARYCVRSASMARYRCLKQKFINCMEAASLATGCELKVQWLPAYWDIRTNETLASKYVEHMERLGVHFPTPFEQKAAQDCFSTDMGNVTYVVPSIHPTFALDSPDASIHTPEFASVARSEDSHERALRCGKAMAATALQILLDDGYAAMVQLEFDQMDRTLASDPAVA